VCLSKKLTQELFGLFNIPVTQANYNTSFKIWLSQRMPIRTVLCNLLLLVHKKVTQKNTHKQVTNCPPVSKHKQ
jgi:hypothetical protein